MSISSDFLLYQQMDLKNPQNIHKNILNENSRIFELPFCNSAVDKYVLVLCTVGKQRSVRKPFVSAIIHWYENDAIVSIVKLWNSDRDKPVIFSSCMITIVLAVLVFMQ